MAALFEAVADGLSDELSQEITAAVVEERIGRLYAVPSDAFWAAWDAEVGRLIDRYQQQS